MHPPYDRLLNDVVAVGPLHQDSPRMATVWECLERAKDAGDAVVIAARRRLIVAERLGRKRHADPADWRLVKAFSEDPTE